MIPAWLILPAAVSALWCYREAFLSTFGSGKPKEPKLSPRKLLGICQRCGRTGRMVVTDGITISKYIYDDDCLHDHCVPREILAGAVMMLPRPMPPSVEIRHE